MPGRPEDRRGDRRRLSQGAPRGRTVLGDSPTKAQYEALGRTPSASTILRHCDGWNAAKSRAGLERNRSTGSRVAPKPDDVDPPEEMEWEESSQDQRWHYRHGEWNTRRTLERRRELRRWIHVYKAERMAAVGVGSRVPRASTSTTTTTPPRR
ncbi:MAG: homing endonuclease associated repeat-containing protein [Haloferacaceae archaeon]